MSTFLRFANEIIWLLLSAIADFFIGIWKSFVGIGSGFKEGFALFTAYSKDFGFLQWVFAILLIAAILGIFGIIAYRLFLLVKRAIIRRHSLVTEEDLLLEIGDLNKQVTSLITEKNKIMAMKVSQLGLSPDAIESEPADSGSSATANNTARFPKLASVDEQFISAPERIFDNDITLPDIVERYKDFACNRMGLYYDQRTIRLFIASMATTKLIILEGISGTGKTSLPYSFAKFLNSQAGMVSVQPSYRDRTELLGYFNEFTKRFNETEFLRCVYAAGYEKSPCLIVLDEMNLARIEYYFADMLSVLEMPTPDEWLVDLVPTPWNSDPKNIVDGKLKVPTNLWFIGTANNDDSTFTITDKVYDRSMPIELNWRMDPFTAPDSAPLNLSWEHLSDMFAQAKIDFAMTDMAHGRLEKLNTYLINQFRLSIGNRIMKQMFDFIPVFVACGGTEMDAMDYIVERKILKKFESLNINFDKDNMRDLINFIEKTFGKTGLHSSKRYLQKLQTMF